VRGVLATRYHGDGDIRVDEVPEPGLREPTDALVRVTLAGICGSDLHFYRAGSALGFAPPERVGHEFVGEVLEVGAEVRGVRPGQAVVSSPSIADGSCEMCRERLYYACERGLGFFGYSGAFWHYGGPVEGGQSELVRVPFADYTLVPVPEELAAPELRPALVGIIDVMGTGWHGADAAGVAPGDDVLVVGDGAVGLCAAHAAVARGARRVILAGHHADRLAIGRTLGATDVVETRDPAEAGELVRGLTGGHGARVVIASVSGDAPLATAHACVKAGGVISCIGLDQAVGAPPGVDWMDQFLRNITITGGLVPGRRNVPHLMGLLAEGAIDPTPVFTHRLPLERAADGYRMMARREEGVVKVVLEPGA
jgi:threonine dehydrogenase-like Zn-dependent dehydrogenase